jgi:sugar phosphate isomerase/epimerase
VPTTSIRHRGWLTPAPDPALGARCACERRHLVPDGIDLDLVLVKTDVGICPATLLVDAFGAGPDELRAAGAAATAAGFRDASFWTFQLDGFAGSGLRPVVLEAALAWAGDDAAAAAAEAEQYAALAAERSSSLVMAVTMAPTITDVARARRQLGDLARVVAEQGATVCVEFFAWSALNDLRTTWDLVAPIPDVGLVLDTFHWQRQPGGPDWELLASLPGDRICYVQLADAGATPMADPEAEAMTARLLPGEGVVDFARLFDVLDAIGADPFVATETFNPSVVERLGADAAALAIRDAARSVLE